MSDDAFWRSSARAVYLLVRQRQIMRLQSIGSKGSRSAPVQPKRVKLNYLPHP